MSENPVTTADALDRPGLVRVADSDRVRTVTLDRVDALNAFNEALYDAVTDTLLHSAEDPGVAVVLLTGSGRAFCAGTDLLEMAARGSDPDFKPGVHGFLGLIDALIAFPKPLIIAVNGSRARHRHHHFGVCRSGLHVDHGAAQVPLHQPRRLSRSGIELHLPRACGPAERDVGADELGVDRSRRGAFHRIGLEGDRARCAVARGAAVRRRCWRPNPSPVWSTPRRRSSRRFASNSAAARARESASFAELMGGPANAEALAAFAEKRPADFTRLPPGA